MPRARSRRRRRLLFALLVLALLVWWWRRTPPLVLGTFNIRVFPDVHTKLDAVADAIAELDADAFAVQEIGDPGKLDEALALANARTGRRYVASLHPYCWPLKDKERRYDRLHLGVVHDADKIDLVRNLSLSPGKTCPNGQAPAALALLQPHRGPPLSLVSVHMSAHPDGFERRKKQWAWLLEILPRLAAAHGAPVVLAGDFNTTGYHDEPPEERRMIDDLIEQHDLALPTATLPCTEYWQPNKSGPPFKPSLLDHVVFPNALGAAQAEVLGMCAAAACAELKKAPPEFDTVSDHCPVRVTLRR